MDHKKHFAAVLRSLAANNLDIEYLVGDNPKRSFFRDALCHSARFGCEYCFQCGINFCSKHDKENRDYIEKLLKKKQNILNQIDDLDPETDHEQIETLNSMLENVVEAHTMAKKKHYSSHIVWPANTMGGELRTKEKILEIVEQIEAGNDLTPQERKGIKGRSLMLDIDGFDFVIAIPTEYMHCVCIGTTKRLIELTFSVGENRTRNLKTPLASPTLFNEIMKTIKMFKEFSRRARKLDLSVIKAQELRNILLFYFPVVTKCVKENEKEVRAWELLAFMIRACILPENEYENVNVNHIKYCQKNFYSTYEQNYGSVNCTYSIHVVASHLFSMRSLGPFTETSAFPFEAFYAELRNSFQPGTVSVVKQMLQNVLLKRILSNHVCEEKIYLSAKDTALECNSLIYVFENSKHSIFKIKSIENDNLICNQMGNYDIKLPCTPMLDWSSVGVYEKGGLSDVETIVDRNNVAGKVMKVDKYLITCPNNILREK